VFNTAREFDMASPAEIAAIDDLGATVLHKATREGNLKIIMAVLQRMPVSARASFANVQTYSNAGRSGLRSALHEAALRGNVRAATSLLIHGARLDLRDGHGRTPLEIWARMGHPIADISSVISLLGVARR
jgi:ankyrin repeat protein